MATPVHPSVNQGTLELVMSVLEEEKQKDLCLVISLMNRLEPKNLNDLQDSDDIVSFRLLQVLEARLTCTRLMDMLKGVLHLAAQAERHPSAQAAPAPQ
jgi:hypothetical protein